MTRSWPSQAGAQSGPPPERLPPERLPLHAGPLSRVEHVRSAGAGPAFPVRARLHGLSLRPLRGRITVCARRRASVRAAARHRVGETLWSHQGLTFGRVIAHTEPDRKARARRLRRHCRPRLRRRHRTYGLQGQSPCLPTLPSDEDLYVLFRRHARLIRRDLSAAIRLDDRLPYRKGRRASLKGAKSSDLQVARSTDFEAFMALEERTLARHGATPTHTGAELALLAGRFPDHI
jgi:hypothetical protein